MVAVSGGWVIGWAIGAAVVVVVVVLLLTMIVLARKAAATAERIRASLGDARVNTLGLWGVTTTNRTAERIVANAAAAREALAAKAGRR